MDTYEKKYKDANKKVSVRFGSNVAKEIFPDLYEGEDERIVKELLTFFREGMHGGHILTNKEYDSWIAWLEKQGEKKSIDDLTQQEAMDIAVAKCFEQGEQKPTDKVEPKFKVGDEIKTANEESLTITNIDEKGYWSKDLFICDFDEECLWDLVEQKPAETVKWSPQEESCICQLESLVKERWRQADKVHNSVIIKKMSELMFFLKTLNPNKKPQRIISAEVKEAMYDKPAGSEEDERIYNNLTEFESSLKHIMEEAIECGDTHNLKADADMLLRLVQKPWSEEDREMSRFIGNAITVNDASIYLESKGIQVIDAHVWLEELKERVQPQSHWRPSYEQVSVLEFVIEDIEKDSIRYRILNSVLEDLKKLREE